MRISASFDESVIKNRWLENYKTSPEQLDKMSGVNGLISAFNANIDAVIKISGKEIEAIVQRFEMNESDLLKDDVRQIRTREDAIRGIVHCFKSGIAEEWLVEDVDEYKWLEKEIGYTKLQMGGQGGIVANVMAVCGVDPVYVHCASIPSLQAELFLDLDNLQSVDEEGAIKKARNINRENDIPLVHWIIEFDKGDKVSLDGQVITCPKSNRFIATYDPLNFKLHIDQGFASKMAELTDNIEVVILSGYQMLKEKLGDGNRGDLRIDESMKIIENWRSTSLNQILHLEMASTQDRAMRKHLLDSLAKKVDSLGFNERELIDLLEVMGENELVKDCEQETNSINMFKGMVKLFEYTSVPRMQLHMFGLYLTLQKKNFTIKPEENRNGMQLAAVIAAAKAGTGAIDSKNVLLWAKGKKVSDKGIQELAELSGYINDHHSSNELLHSGIWEADGFDLIAVPTILIDKPVTLVGMGDTISSISLVAAR